MTQIRDMHSRFGFKQTPFTRELRTIDRFRTPAHDAALEALRRTIDERMSAVLIAPAGCGKTTLLRALRDSLSQSRYRCHYIKVNDLSKRDFCRELAHVLGLPPVGTYPALVRRLQEHLENGFSQERLHWLLILDEAHDYRPEVLSILRILTNFDMDSRLVVSLLLAGQTPLSAMLERESLRAVAARMSHRAELEPLSALELEQYLAHRCKIAGADHTPFDVQAVQGIFDITRGNFRACDHLAYKALEVAHDSDADSVTSHHVIKAREFVS